MSTLILFALIVLFVIFSIRHICHHGSCANHCSSCGKGCSSKKKASLVERYRKDHPGIGCSCSSHSTKVH